MGQLRKDVRGMGSVDISLFIECSVLLRVFARDLLEGEESWDETDGRVFLKVNARV